MSSDRRSQILDAAARLFADRGFHGVSVHDIGAACGISGPAIYRHFAGKDDVLDHVLTSISERHVAEGTARVDRADSANEALDLLLTWHVDFAVDHPELIVIQDREWFHLTPQAQCRVRELQLSYIDAWTATVLVLRADFDRATARAAVQATFGLLNSTPHSARIGNEAMRTLLTDMARASLRVERAELGVVTD